MILYRCGQDRWETLCGGDPVVGERGALSAGEEPGPGASTRRTEGAHTALIDRTSGVGNDRVGAWMAEAMSRRQQVFYKHAEAGPAARRRLAVLLGSDVLDSERVVLIDAARCHADTGGEPAALRAWHRALIEQACRAGHRGAAIVCDGAALHTITPDPAAMLTHERDLTELAATNPLTVLCRYDISVETAPVLHRLIGLHTALEDITFAARRDPGALTVSGEIDISNAARLGAVLRAAIEEGIRIVDLGELRLLGAAGAHVLLEALPLLRAGQTLTLHRPHDLVRQILDITGLGRHENVVVSE
ncbi:hypothetical protein GCM10023215_06850 [Pseudonocardia yuanmonensis]|uniref:STAS domain-containing protein n=1 Tax=Pseudonocardia yuanmonensis TaxID=1095914 RepID=A0ABP8W1U6_9PSEU